MFLIPENLSDIDLPKPSIPLRTVVRSRPVKLSIKSRTVFITNLIAFPMLNKIASIGFMFLTALRRGTDNFVKLLNSISTTSASLLPIVTNIPLSFITSLICINNKPREAPVDPSLLRFSNILLIGIINTCNESLNTSNTENSPLKVNCNCFVPTLVICIFLKKSLKDFVASISFKPIDVTVFSPLAIFGKKY